MSVGAWPLGFPNVYKVADMAQHPSRIPVLPGSRRLEPKGVAWLEAGGTKTEWNDWLGIVPVDSFPIRFNGKKPGLYAVAVKTDEGDKIIRLPSITQFVLKAQFGNWTNKVS